MRREYDGGGAVEREGARRIGRVKPIAGTMPGMTGAVQSSVRALPEKVERRLTM
jgi:hypothetical protein